jgi:hypothetical protein
LGAASLHVFALTSASTQYFICTLYTYQALEKKDSRRWNMAVNASPDLLQQQQIPDLPPKMFYIPNFITEDEEQRILDKVGFTK